MTLPYGHQSINEDDVAAVVAALKGELLTRGPNVEAFEKSLAQHVGAEYAVAFNNGSTALSAAYWVSDIGPQDRVLTSPNTFIATTGFASQQGASIKFIDIDRNSGNINLDQLEQNLQFRSLRGRLFIVPIHFSGIAVDMARLQQMIRATNVVVIEDAAHALGSSYTDGQKVGCCAYSDMTIFSFHPVKNITTGEGGMVTTNDSELYRKLKQFRNSGIVKESPYLLQGTAAPWYYEVQAITGNFHMTEFQAALGLSQLKRLDAFVEKRRSLVARYRQLFKGTSIKLFDEKYDALSAYHLLVAQIDFRAFKTNRSALMEALSTQGIGTQLHYIPLYRHPCYRRVLGDLEESFPEMETYYSQALSLPLYYDLTFEDVDRVVDCLMNKLK